MQQTVSLIVLLALAARICSADIVMKTRESEQLTNLYEATIDVLTTCYGDPSQTIGVVGDSDGSILKTLWSTYFIPAILVDTEMTVDNSVTTKNQHRLQVFVIVADSPERFSSLMTEIMSSIWWNHYANFLILNPTADRSHDESSTIDAYLLYLAFERFGVLNAQVIYPDGASNVSIVTSNPFSRRAPEPWQFLRTLTTRPAPFNVFKRTYRQGGQACEALRFAKTLDLNGYPLHFLSKYRKFNVLLRRGNLNPTKNAVFNAFFNTVIWFIHLIEIDLNASSVINEDVENTAVGMEVAPIFFSDFEPLVDERITYPLLRDELYGITQHTGHMTQLEKILSVIDRPSRIGLWIVYLVTFLFFKFFLRQAVVPSILDLVRLTCGAGLLKLPPNVAPTIYLACLFMFVVTLQGIFTGNLATLLTTNIHYPNVNKRQDIVNLGYTIYTNFDKYFGDPMFDGHVVLIEQGSGPKCVDYVLSDPLAICVDTYFTNIILASKHLLHMSRDAIDSDYMIYILTENNPFGRTLDATITKWVENALRNRDTDESLAVVRADLLNDKVVNSNTERKVMDLDDLRFAFVILGIGLTCSLVCFICEIIIYRVRSKITKRRARARNRVFVATRNRPFP